MNELNNNELKKLLDLALAGSQSDMYVFDLPNDEYLEIHASDWTSALLGKHGSIREATELVAAQLEDPEHARGLRDFTDPDLLREKFREKSTLSYYFRGKNLGWLRAQLIVVERDPAGDACKVILVTHPGDEAMNEHADLTERDLQNRKMIDVLGSEYSELLYLDLDTLKVHRYRNGDGFRDVAIETYEEFWWNLVDYVENRVSKEDRSALMDHCELQGIRVNLANQKTFVQSYRNSRGEFCMLRMIKMDDVDEPAHQVAIGFANKHAEEMASQEADKSNHYKEEMERALASEYDSIYYVDVDTAKIYSGSNGTENVREYSKIAFSEAGYETAYNMYVTNRVLEKDQQMMLDTGRLEYLKEALRHQKVLETIFQTDDEQYCMRRVVKVQGDDEEAHELIICFGNKDHELRPAQEMKEERARYLEQIERQTVELQQNRQQLQLALAQANAASKAKTMFLSNMSHDIRTPMNAIIGFTTLAAAHIDDTELLKDYLSRITAASKHLLGLINDVLDMSRIESGRMELDEKPNSLPTIIHDLRNVLQANIAAKQLEFFIDTVDVVDENVICDELRLNQVLLNCLSNAIKYTNPGGTIALRIIQKPAEREGWANYEFKVRDSGIGMSEEYLKHIFEAFTRESNSTVSRIEGTGLGMAITKNIVDLMDGEISVTSELGKGTEFIIDLPLQVGQSDDAALDTSSLQGLRVLVADDDFNACTSVSQMLESIGMRAEWTTYGKDAVMRAEYAYERKDAFSAYIIDWLMPDMNGIEVVRRIRGVIGKDTPIIIMTAYDWTDIEKEARDAGVTAFVAKPLFLTDVKKALLRVQEEKVQSSDILKTTTRRYAGKRALIVEDIEVNRLILKELLSDTGILFDEAENGAIAVEKLKAAEPGAYDVILMDVQMPVMDGLSASRVIRSSGIPWLSEVPILAMTANAFAEDKAAVIEAGMDDHVAKPLDLSQLFSTLDRHLQ